VFTGPGKLRLKLESLVVSHKHPNPVSSERGVALVIAVMFLLVSSVLAATFMFSVTGERSIASNTHVAKGSLYAADAGVRVSQQMLANLSQTKLDSLVSIWPGTGAVITAPNSLFPAGAMPASATSPNFSSSATVVFSDSDLTDTAQVYNYICTISSTGHQGVLGQRSVQSQSILRVSASRGSFADFLLFTNTHLSSSGTPIWFASSSKFDGRVHTNGEFRFAYNPTFQDLATSVNGKAWFYNSGSAKELAANNNGTIDVPSFFGGFTRGATAISLPANAYSQQNAALGLSPSLTTSPSNSTVNTAIGNGSGTGTPPNGVYVIHSGSNVTGGIYVQGNLNQCLMKVDSLGRQVYQLTQGSTTTTLTVDLSSNQTLVKVGSTTTTYNGLPRGIAYINGDASDVRGPDRVSGTPAPAIATNTQILIAASGDIVIQRDITSENFNSATSVLGLYSSGGNVRVGSGTPNDAQVDAYVMSTGSSGQFCVDNYDSGSPRGTFHLRGGSVTSYYGAFYTFNGSGVLQTGFARDFHYDRRGLVPPYYPTTNRFTSDRPIARTVVWKEI